MNLAETAIAPLIDLPYDEQLAVRQAKVQKALGWLGVRVSPIIPSPRVEGSRARLTLRQAASHANAPSRLGFHLPGSHSHWIPDSTDLARLARPEVVAGVGLLDALGLTIRADVEVRSDGERAIFAFSEPNPVPRTVPGADGDVELAVAINGKRRSGRPILTVDGLRVSPSSFMQVNLEVNRLVVADVDAILQDIVPVGILDLYGGVGNLSALAATRGVHVALADNEGSATDDAKKNLPGADVMAMDVGKWKPGQSFYDVAILDPPRSGAPGMLAKVAVTRPRVILYLSCDPLTLARDLGTIHGRGYRVVRVQPYDMFPGTEHVETLAVLQRV